MGNSKSSAAASAAEKALVNLFARPSAFASDQFALVASGHHGVPSDACAIACCALQGLLAVGTASGAVKLFGGDALEVLLASPAAQSEHQAALACGVVFLQFTARQRLVVTYSDSSLRIFDLADPSRPHAELPASWTTSTITCIETIRYQHFPFVFVATDDGNIHVVHEDTGRVSSYKITPHDVGIASTTGETTLPPVVTALASNPRDANQLLVAFDTTARVFLWDFAKRKVLREFTLARPKALARASMSGHSISSHSIDSATDSSAADLAVNAPLTLSWHASGKRFAAGYRRGGIAIFRYDKPVGFYHDVVVTDNTSTNDSTNTSGSDTTVAIQQLHWVCAPPTSKNAQLPGALLFTRAGAAALTLVYPPPDAAPDDALSALAKSEQLAWRVATIASANCAEIAGFAVASDAVDASIKPAPLAAVVLSGNPLDGCVPSVSVQPLPCFVRLAAHDREDWDWRLDRLPQAGAIPPLLQRSALTALAVVDLAHANGALQDDLFTTFEPAALDRAYALLASDDWDWPISGGSVVEPLLARFAAASGAVLQDEMRVLGQSATLLLTGHANGCVLIWELLVPAERASRGTLQLLHAIDVLQLLQAIEIAERAASPDESLESPAVSTSATARTISCLSFCADARVLVVGFATGELAVLEFGHWTHQRPSALHESHFASVNESSATAAAAATASLPTTGFRVLFTAHVHTHAITHVALSTAYGFVAAADASGVVSLTQLATQSHRLLVCELVDAPTSVDALLMGELVQTAELPPSHVASPASAKATGKRSPTKMQQRTTRSLSSSSGADSALLAQCREVVPVLFVGRGAGSLELFHVQSGAKVAESVVDAHKAASVSALLMVDADGQQIAIPGRVWTEQGDGLAASDGDDSHDVDAGSGSTAHHDTSAPEGNDTVDDVETVDADTSANARHVRSPSTELEFTKQLVLAVIREQAASADDVVLVQDEQTLLLAAPTRSGSHTNVIDVTVPAGPLGLHLFTDAATLAVVKGFVADSATATMLEASGVRAGHVITAINGLDVTPFGLHVVIAVLEQLRDREKTIAFANGLVAALPSVLTDESVAAAAGATVVRRASTKSIGAFSDLLDDGANHADVARPRFVLAACGRSIYLLPATLPQASDMALGVRESPAQPLATAELRAPVVALAVVRVPVAQRVERCVVVLDQSSCVSVLSLLSLAIVAQHEAPAPAPALGHALCCVITASGELVVATAFGELARFSCFADATAMESAMLARKCVKTRLVRPERAGPFSTDSANTAGSSTMPTVPPVKKLSGIADAGKLFKKLVAGLKDDVDLARVFHFATPEHERAQLLGDRTAVATARKGDSDATQRSSGAVAKTTSKGMGDTKDALMQAAQHLNERGEKLGDLALKTEQMKQTSEDFYHTMRAFNEKNAKKKWYDF